MISISPAGVILLAVQAAIIVKNKSLKQALQGLFITTAIICVFVDIGYFIKVGDSFTLSLRIESVVVLCAASLLHMRNCDLSKHYCLCAGVIIGCALLGYFALEVGLIRDQAVVVGQSWDLYAVGNEQKTDLSISRQTVFAMAQLIMYLIIMSVLNSVLRKTDWEHVFAQLFKAAVVFLMVCALEIVIKDVLSSQLYNVFLNSFFGVSAATYTSLTLRGSLYLLQGLSKEASTFCVVLLFTFFIVLVRLHLTKQKTNITLLAAQFGILILSTSVIGIEIAIIELLVLLVFVYCNVNKRIGIVSGLAIAFLVLLSLVVVMMSDSYLSTRLHNAVNQITIVASDNWNQGDVYSSELARLGSIADSIRLILAHPLLGVGFGVSHCHSYLINVFLNMGCISACAWLYLQYCYFLRNLIPVRTGYYCVVVVMLLGTLFYGGDLIMVYGIAYLILVAMMRFLFSGDSTSPLSEVEEVTSFNRE